MCGSPQNSFVTRHRGHRGSTTGVCKGASLRDETGVKDDPTPYNACGARLQPDAAIATPR